MQEAEDKYQTLQAMIHPDVGRQRLSTDLEVDLTDLPLDEPVPEDLIPRTSNLHKGYFDEIARMIREDRPTLRQLYMRYERGTRSVRGTPRHCADVLEDWFTTGAADGFMLIVHLQPAGLADFIRYIVPELQRRKLFRTEYAGTTLREHLGLARPANRHVAGAGAEMMGVAQ
jgi:alkanesulfonate monooxygenase SsuD/methylene tetrahydromethanopterin reductase-like flavin-dependent oxidoreductase (luciferase family)